MLFYFQDGRVLIIDYLMIKDECDRMELQEGGWAWKYGANHYLVFAKCFEEVGKPDSGCSIKLERLSNCIPFTIGSVVL